MIKGSFDFTFLCPHEDDNHGEFPPHQRIPAHNHVLSSIVLSATMFSISSTSFTLNIATIATSHRVDDVLNGQALIIATFICLQK